MSEQAGKYEVEESAENALAMLGKGYEPAAEIHPPKTIKALRENGLNEYKVWGWVKVSANFIYHIKKLRGAKLAIWQIISLSIDEDGECKLSMNEIAELSGYSRSETIESTQELEDMGYLSVQKETGKKNMYEPSFVARGINQPTEQPVQKNDQSSPVDGDQSSPVREKSVSSYRELKELKNSSLSKQELAEVKDEANKEVDAILELERQAQDRRNNGKAWRGRELLPDRALPYADWFHAETGLEMYGKKSKAKLNTEWLKACNVLWENEITIESLKEAKLRDAWRPLVNLSQLVPIAKAVQASGHKTDESREVYTDAEGIPLS